MYTQSNDYPCVRAEGYYGRTVTAIAVEVDVPTLGETIQVEGVAKRDNRDRYDDRIGETLALGRALRAAGNKLLVRAAGYVKHQEDMREARPAQLAKRAEWQARQNQPKPKRVSTDDLTDSEKEQVLRWGDLMAFVFNVPPFIMGAKPEAEAETTTDTAKIEVLAGVVPEPEKPEAATPEPESTGPIMSSNLPASTMKRDPRWNGEKPGPLCNCDGCVKKYPRPITGGWDFTKGGPPNKVDARWNGKEARGCNCDGCVKWFSKYPGAKQTL